MKVTVELDEGVPERTRRTLASLREVEVVVGDSPRVSLAGSEWPLSLLPRPQSNGDALEAANDMARRIPPGAVGLVVANSIPQRERDALEAVGLSWVDGRGAMHLSRDNLLIHIDRTGRVVPQRPGTEEVGGIGPAGIRAVQVLLGDPTSDWTTSRLAGEAAISTGQAHKVFRALERNRLVESRGRGPQQRRVITDYQAALDWLASTDRARRRPEAIGTYLYARTGEQLMRRFAERAERAGLPYAVTGATASGLLGVPVLTNIAVTPVRVGALPAVEALNALGLEHLDAEEAGRGINLELWTDTGQLGVFGATDHEGIRVAPPIRVWLDMARQGGRSDDAAQLFREQVLERA